MKVVAVLFAAVMAVTPFGGIGIGAAALNTGVKIDVSKTVTTQQYVTSFNFTDEYVKMVIKDDKLYIWMQTTGDIASCMFGINIYDYKVTDTKTYASGATWISYSVTKKPGGINEDFDIDKTGYVQKTIDIGGLKDGTYTLRISLGKERYDWHTEYIETKVYVSGGAAAFIESPMYGHNWKAAEISAKANPNDYLSVDLTTAQRSELAELARKIVGDEKDGYKKLRLIHDWVASNIYYDKDAYYSGKITAASVSAYATFQSKRSVCAGYAELFAALTRLAGIPCKVAYGHAIQSNENWSGKKHNYSDHAWNEAYIDGRWVIVDATWDSRNRYENGKYEKGEVRYNYFDPAIAAFSQTHKINGYK
jgi:transglutaminase-like putative cysteine protease